MTRTEKLDRVLMLLLALDVKELKKEPISKKITMEFINSADSDLELMDWEMKSLRDELINEGLIMDSNDELRITQKGKKFITNEQGFEKIKKTKTQDDIIREQTIEKFKYVKYGFWISITAIIISLTSLIWTILKQ